MERLFENTTKKNARIKVCGLAASGDEPIELYCNGSVQDVQFGTIIEYSEAMGGVNSKVSHKIMISGDIVSLTRQDEGGCVSTLIFDKKQLTKTKLVTSFGEIPITVKTSESSYFKNDDELRLKLKYTMLFAEDAKEEINLNLTCQYN